MRGSGSGSGCSWIWRLVLILQLVGGIHSWGKKGHYATCNIADEYLSEDAKAAVRELLPSSSQGDLASLCSWADEIRFHYHWSSALHYCDTPDFTYICVTGAIFNYTKQLEDAFQDSQLIAKFNKTEALLFLSHFLGDVHQPLHVAFTGDEGWNTIIVHWYRRKSNLHHIWDSMIIETALKTFYGNDLLYMIESIRWNITNVWANDLSDWKDCKSNQTACPDPYASESIRLACKYAYKKCHARKHFTCGAYGWSKEGHVMTCQIAQSLLKPDVAEAVGHLLPAYAKGDLSSLCTWPDQIRHWHKYLWTSSLHFIDTPDNTCSFDYSRDCHDQHGLKNMCVAGALQNFTSQLLHYKEGIADRRYNMTEALLFLSHFMGDIHQPMHVGFSSDEGGNTIELHWFRRKSNLHHVWDRDIILTAAADYYEKDMSLLIQDIEANFTDGVWSDDTSSWTNCEDLLSCPIKYAAESISLACKWAYKGVQPGVTLSDDYFDSRMPVVMKRIAQGGVRLAMILNRVLGTDADEGCTSPT